MRQANLLQLALADVTKVLEYVIRYFVALSDNLYYLITISRALLLKLFLLPLLFDLLNHIRICQ